VTNLLGGPPAAVPDRYVQASARTMLPLGVAQILIWGEHDNFVRSSRSNPLTIARTTDQLVTA
jgi:hypothetical protein